MYKTSRQQSFY